MRKKVCNKCKVDKVIKEFQKDNKRKEGLKTLCKTCVAENNAKLYQKKKQNIRRRQKIYQQETKQQRAVQKRKHYKANREQILKQKVEYQKSEWYQTLKPKIAKRKTEQQKRRKAIDPLFKLSTNIRSLIQGCIKKKGFKKKSKTAHILGCSFEELHLHLRQSFELNYGIPFAHIDTKLIHIDHIIPLSTGKTEEEVLKLNHYSNLQYLFSWDNLEKGNKLNWKQQ